MALFPQLCGLFGRFRRDEDGNAIVEFALVAPVFLLLVFMILEDGLLIFTQAQLDNATRDAARAILIGSFQTSGKSLSDFQTSVCSGIAGLIPSCGNNIQVYAETDGTSAANLSAATSGYWDGTSGAFTSSNIGGPSNYQIIQVGYQYPYLVPWLAKISGGGSAMLVSTIVFQVEPYQ